MLASLLSRLRLRLWRLIATTYEPDPDHDGFLGRGLVQEDPRAAVTVAVPGGAEWTVRQQLRDWCTFRRHNLLEPLRGPRHDCIFIRNVMIYFDRNSKATATQHLLDALAPGGYLVVGPADGLYDMLGGLEKRSTFLFQKPEGPSVTPGPGQPRQQR